jgi:hypothetical protein
MHRAESDGQCRRVFEGHVVREGDRPTPIANGILRVAARACAHHTVAGLEAALGLSPDLHDFTGPVEPNGRANVPVAASASRSGEISPVQPSRPHFHQKLKRLGARPWNVANLQPILRRYAGLHYDILLSTHVSDL